MNGTKSRRCSWIAAALLGCAALGLQPANAGGISGQVTASDGTTPLAGINVDAYQWNAEWEYWKWLSSLNTDASGNYDIDGLAAGTYRVQFYDPNNVYVEEAYDDTSSIYLGTDIVVPAETTVEDIDASLAEGSHIKGTVTASDGTTPLAGIEVWAYQWNAEWEYWDWVSSSGTDVSGNYDFGGLVAGTYRVEFDDPNSVYVGEAYDDTSSIYLGTDIVVPAETTVEDIDASLSEGSHITGTVTGPDGTTPLEGISVTAYCWSDGGLGSSEPVVGWVWMGGGETDADGHYDIGGLRVGTYHVRYRDYDGTYAPEFYGNAPGHDSAADIAVAASTTVNGIDASLGDASHITGTVTGPDGTTPLEGIGVSAYRWSEGHVDSYVGVNWEEVDSEQTDISGNYDIGGLPAGTYRVRFGLWQGSYATEVYDNAADLDSGADVIVTAGATSDGIDASLSAGSQILGRVTGPDGTTPLAGIDVNVFVESWSDEWGGYSFWDYAGWGQTGSDGRYAVEGLDPGTYRVEFNDPSGTYLRETYDDKAEWWQGTDIQVPYMTSVGNIDASLDLPSAIEGRVTASDGTTPLEGIEAVAYKWNTEWEYWEWMSSSYTDSSGNYDIGGLAAGTYRVQFYDLSNVYVDEIYDGVQSTSPWDGGTDIALPPGTELAGIDATLELPSAIEGRVTAAAGGAPLEGIRVSAYRWNEGDGGRSTYSFASSETDADGRYSLGGLATGTYRVEFSDGSGRCVREVYDNLLGGSIFEGTDVVVPSETTVSDIDATLEEFASIAGTVLGGGLPLPGARIKAFNPDFRWTIYETVADAHGAFTLPRLLPGVYTVKVEADGFADLWWIAAGIATNAATVPLAPGGEAVLDFNLVIGQSPALVQVTSDPPGAAIYLDYQPTGEVTPAVIDVGEIGTTDSIGNPLASHVITLKRTGSPKPAPRTITPVEAETTVEHFDLTGEYAGSILVETTPAGAEVFVDYADEALGVTPLRVENLAPGTHTILLRKDGYLRPRPVMARARAGDNFVESSQTNSFAAVGTPQGWHADDACWEVALPFAFPFYGVARTKVVVGSNGTLAFDGDFSPWGFDDYSFKYRPMIAVMAADLLTTTPGDIAILSTADAFTVRWDARYYSGGDAVRASATLHADGRIEIKYGEGNTRGGVIGVSAGDGDRFAFSPRSQSGSMEQADDIVYEPVFTPVPTLVQIPLVAESAGPEIAVAVESPLVPDMAVYVDYLPTEQVTDAVVEGLDAATHSGSYLGQNWRTASHTILLRKPGVRPFAPRDVGDEFGVVQTLSAEPWMSVISLPEALDTEGAAHPPAWSTGPLESRWSGVGEVDGNGEDAARSGAIGHGEASWLVMNVTNSGSLAFNWRASCQPRYDYLLLIVDGVAKGRISGESGWLSKTVEIAGEGPHEIVWNFIKDGSVSEGLDCAWVDQVVWTPDPALTLEAALDATNLVWSTWGDIPWKPITSPSLDGEDAARSGPVGDYGVSVLATTATGPGLLQFVWRASCETYGDWLDFVVDGVLVETLTGEAGWQDVVVELGPGEHALSWEYWKNEGGASGDDAGWLDCVLWTPYGDPATHTGTTPVPVPYAWLDGFPGLLASFGGDYEAAALSANGKRDVGGNPLAVWQDYVAGTCPTNPASQFRCFIGMEGGMPVLSWDPDLGNERVYTLWGRPDLSSAWTTPTKAASRFFRVGVSLP